MNIIYAQLGAKYDFSAYNAATPHISEYQPHADLEAKAVISGFSREIHYRDHKSFFVGSVHIGITTPITNWYSIGGGVDVFYDGAFTKREMPIFRLPNAARYITG